MLKKLNTNQKLGIGAVCAVLLIALIVGLWPRRGSRELVIVNGVEYELLGVKSVTPDLGEGVEPFETYLLTLAYDEPNVGTKRGTILVPKVAVFRDYRLPENKVIWDPPIILEGKTYAVARWNPKRLLPDDASPAIVPEEPLTRNPN